MLKLRDIMTRDLLTFTPETTVRDAMEMLAVRHVSGAPVVVKGAVVGVVSTTDLLQLIGALPIAPEDARPAPEEEEPEGAAELPRAEREAVFADLPGWEGGTPGSYYREEWTELPPEASEVLASPAGPEWAALDEHTVAEAMNTSLIALGSDADVTEAAKLMERFGIHRVLVMDGGRLVGLVSALDVAKAVADHRITAQRYVFPRRGRHDEREDTETDTSL
ncbi:MAG: CBS domain-containing protein [Gemmatimonadaceae bacterium]|nr:CBS domain-containing protein [Gemmatimonadaceae bacterium]